MQTLDQLGAGFTLASHDLDIRGAGNLLGDEQSGHIREVGIELYQHLLEEAIGNARSGEGALGEAPEDWTPQITIGTPVLIPETYVADLNVRLGLYRRIAALVDRREIDAFAAELIDRFGPLPPEVDNLLEIIAIKRLCRDAGVEKVEAGPKGAVIAFHDNRFANPAGLVRLHRGKRRERRKLRPDQTPRLMRNWETPDDRLKGITAHAAAPRRDRGRRARRGAEARAREGRALASAVHATAFAPSSIATTSSVLFTSAKLRCMVLSSDSCVSRWTSATASLTRIMR